MLKIWPVCKIRIIIGNVYGSYWIVSAPTEFCSIWLCSSVWLREIVESSCEIPLCECGYFTWNFIGYDMRPKLTYRKMLLSVISGSWQCHCSMQYDRVKPSCNNDSYLLNKTNNRHISTNKNENLLCWVYMCAICST